MMVHNVHFEGFRLNIIRKLSLVSLLIWSTVSLFVLLQLSLIKSRSLNLLVKSFLQMQRNVYARHPCVAVHLC